MIALSANWTREELGMLISQLFSSDLKSDKCMNIDPLKATLNLIYEVNLVILVDLG